MICYIVSIIHFFVLLHEKRSTCSDLIQVVYPEIYINLKSFSDLLNPR